jgi:hypothetical protein
MIIDTRANALLKEHWQICSALTGVVQHQKLLIWRLKHLMDLQVVKYKCLGDKVLGLELLEDGNYERYKEHKFCLIRNIIFV